MTTVTVFVYTDLQPLQAAFQRLLDAGTDLTPVFQEFGEHLAETHQQAWEASKSPEGEPWAPLKPETWARKKGTKPLFEEGDMLAGLVYRAGPDQLEFGLSDRKAPWHHFGTVRGLRARELIGFSSENINLLLGLLADQIRPSGR